MQSKNRQNITDTKDFSGRFRKLRKELKLSQQELAKKIGFSANTQVSRFEKAQSEPMLETLRKLARLGGADVCIDLHELITGEPSPRGELWQEQYLDVLESLAKYVSWETARLLEERRKLWGELGHAREKQQKGLVGTDEEVAFWESELRRIESRISDIAEDQHYIQEALDRRKIRKS